MPKNGPTPPSPHNPAVFDLCPLFLLLVIGVTIVAEVNALKVGLPLPHHGALLCSADRTAGVRRAVRRDSRATHCARLVLRCDRCTDIACGHAIMPWASAQTIHALPHVYDPQVASLDAALGFQPSFVMGESSCDIPPLRRFVSSSTPRSYFLLPSLPPWRPASGAVWAWAHCHLSGHRRGWFPNLPSTPVIGPAPNFGDAFPYHTALAHLPAPRNCMPSLHTAWVLMAFLATRGMPWQIRVATAIAAAGTMITTLGAGEHYLTDLVVACPFVLLVRGLCASELPMLTRERFGAGLIGAALVAVWGLAVRGVITPATVPGLVPAAMLITVTVSLWLERDLARATDALLETKEVPSSGAAFAQNGSEPSGGGIVVSLTPGHCDTL